MASGSDHEIIFGVSLGINILIWPSIGWLYQHLPQLQDFLSSKNIHLL
jgi:hypothetical protein